MKYASGMVEERAGTTVPDTRVTLWSGDKRKISSGMMAGKKGNFTIVQRLWRLEGASGVQASHQTSHKDICVLPANLKL